MRNESRRAKAGVIAGILALLIVGCSGGASNFAERIAGQEGSIEGRAAPGELLRAVASGKSDRVTALLIAGADINESVGEGDQKVTPLLAAIANGDSRIIELLIRNGAAKEPGFMGYAAYDFLIYLGDEKNAALMGD